MIDPAIARELRQGFEAQRRGDLEQARARYEAVLARSPDQPDALQLLGGIARGAGDLAGAESLWRASLAARPTQPNVWNNLANLLARTDRVAEALQALDRALTLDPRYAEAHYNRARLLHRQGRNTEAGEALQRALAQPIGPRAGMLLLAAQLQQDAGHEQQALATLDAAVAEFPGHGALHHNRGVLLQRLHRPAEALQAYQSAASCGVDEADAHYNRGNTLQALGRGADAEQAYRDALARDPVHALALYDLARLRWRRADDAFDDDLIRAAQANPDSAVPAGLRAHLLLRAERWNDALDAFGDALRRQPAAPGFLSGQGRALSRLGRHEEALASHEAALQGAPDDPELLAHLAEACSRAGMEQAAERHARQAVALAPADQHAWAQWSLALRLLGDPRHGWIEDTGHLVGVMDLAPLGESRGGAACHRDLMVELAALHHDRREPVDQTLRRGTQTLGDLFEQGHPAVNRLKEAIRTAISGWLAQLSPQAGHPFLGRLPSTPGGWRFTDSWSSRLGDGGFHCAHVHPHGWLSAVYYAGLPADVGAEDPTHAGWLHLGQPDGMAQLAPLRWIAPAVGRLVVFPSYLWHGTTPFRGPEPRTTIAFDIVPDEQA